jgi:hypothetical protein
MNLSSVFRAVGYELVVTDTGTTTVLTVHQGTNELRVAVTALPSELAAGIDQAANGIDVWLPSLTRRPNHPVAGWHAPIAALAAGAEPPGPDVTPHPRPEGPT